jgi:hypothetical protein
MPTAIICSAFIFDFDLYWLRFGSPPLFLRCFCLPKVLSICGLLEFSMLIVNLDLPDTFHGCHLLIDRFYSAAAMIARDKRKDKKRAILRVDGGLGCWR